MKFSVVIAAFLGCLACVDATRGQSNDAPLAEPVPSVPLPPGLTPIFDGKSLDRWIQTPMNATTLSGGDIADLPSLLKRLGSKSDPVSAFLAEQLDEGTKASVTTMPADANSRDQKSAVAKGLSKIISGPSIYDQARFKDVTLRPEATELLQKGAQGDAVMRLNRVLLEDAYPAELGKTAATAWVARGGAMASEGAGRGVIYTKQSFDRYRIVFDMRHVSGKPDHAACVLVFCTAPKDGEKALDALGGIQFQVPNGGSWDYRKGKNNSGKGLFTRVVNPQFDAHKWSRVEILVDPASGTARMAVAQPVGSKAVEVLDFKDDTAGQKGPFALQMHNKGLFDEYANLAVELNPASDELITTK